MSDFTRKLRDAALECGCHEGTTCPLHTMMSVPGGMSTVVENAVFEHLAQFVTAWVKPSWLRLLCDCTPIDPTSREKVYRRLCNLWHDMNLDSMDVHNKWMDAGRPVMYPNHAESACKWCTAPIQATKDVLG